MPDISTDFSVNSSRIDSNVPLLAYLEEIRDGRWEAEIYRLRAACADGDKEKAERLKDNLPGAIFSGIFSRRADADLILHSGYLCMDYDGESFEDCAGLKILLSQDKYVYACWDSPRGHGLRILFRIIGEKHREAYMGVAAYLNDEYGILCDTNCINPSRGFRASYDPSIYISTVQVPLFTRYIKEVQVKKIENFAFAQNDFDNLVRQIQARRVNIAESYDQYLKIGFAFANKFGEGGRSYFHIVAQQSQKYNFIKAEKQYTYCIRHNTLNNEAKIATFYYYCKEAGLQVTSERTNKIRKATITGKAAGLKKEQIVANLLKIENISECEDIVSDVFDGIADISDNDSIIDQLEIFIATNYNIRRNVITRNLERDGVGMEQTDINSLWISARRIMNKADYPTFERILLSNFIPKYNPLRDFFETNFPQFTDITNDDNFDSPLVDRMCETIINSSPAFTKYFVKKWLVGIIASVYGEPSPLVLVLIGKVLGTGKTEWLRRFLPEALRHYHAESKLDRDKDDLILLTQKLIIMDDEFSGKSKKEEGKFKMLTSSDIISVREPYGRRNVDLKRLAVLCGTSNPKEVLTDVFENRRIIPIQVDDINKDLYNLIDKTQLFGELYKLYKQGFDWRVISKEDKAYLNSNSHEYEQVSIEGELIMKYFVPSEGSDSEHMTSSDIKVYIEQKTQQRLNVNNIGKMLSKFGFVQKSVRNAAGQSSKKWCVHVINKEVPF